MALRVLAALGLVAVLAGCNADTRHSPDEEVQRALYSNGGDSSITLFTIISNRSGEGAHTGVMIDGSHRALYDPAGSWYHPTAPEQGDMHYGINDALLNFYIDYHARETYHVVVQTIQVSPEVAELALRRFAAAGAAPKATCSLNTTKVLQTLPGFESISTNWYPAKTMRQFAKIPGVTERKVFDDSPDENQALLTAPQTDG